MNQKKSEFNQSGMTQMLTLIEKNVRRNDLKKHFNLAQLIVEDLHTKSSKKLQLKTLGHQTDAKEGNRKSGSDYKVLI